MKYKWFKIITLASSLEENTVDLQNDHFYDGGSVRVANAKITVYLQDFIENQFNKIAITIMPNDNGWNYL